MKQFLSRFPLLALALAFLAAGVWLMPGAAEALQYDRAALAGGELWRAATGHWAHWSADHLVWDLAMFAVFGVLLERRSRARFVAVVGLSAAAISTALWLEAPEFEYYRGLSGIDSALFAAFFAQLLADAWRDRSVLAGVVPALALVGFGGKSVFELATGSAVFVSDGAFSAVPLAHLVGAALGVMVGCSGVPAASRGGGEIRPRRSSLVLPYARPRRATSSSSQPR